MWNGCYYILYSIVYTTVLTLTRKLSGTKLQAAVSTIMLSKHRDVVPKCRKVWDKKKMFCLSMYRDVVHLSEDMCVLIGRCGA